jgi:DNA-binding cell septation regulator SpoVG
MKISIEHFNGERPQFNVSLSSGEGKEPFITVKGCRIVEGTNGAFVSWPATKNQTSGKYWNHVWASEAFNVAVLEEAQKTKPAARTHGEMRRPPPRSDAPF